MVPCICEKNYFSRNILSVHLLFKMSFRGQQKKYNNAKNEMGTECNGIF